VHDRRLAPARLGELAPAILAAAAEDAVARALVTRLADELALLVRRAFAHLGLDAADVVLGGGMLREGGLLVDLLAARLPGGARPVVLREPPVLGAALAALDAAGAPPASHARLRAAFADGAVPDAGCWPASIVHAHADAEIWLDEEALP
jgi:hypothetical protein